MDSSTRPRILRGIHASTVAPAEVLLSRIGNQITFARAFDTALHEEAIWQREIAAADELIESFDPIAGLDELHRRVVEAEKAMSPIGSEAKRYTVHCVGHGHIDMNWMWSWPETVSMTHDTFASVLSLMDRYQELTFSQSQASVYAAIEKYHPALFDQLRERVREGRWEVTATQWVEGDKNLACGEALCRHLLYTRRFFEQRFGLTPEDVPVQWEPDTFGHANTMPMISAAGAVKYYYACRTGGGFEHVRIGDERPPLFWWEAPDGSRVLVNRELTWYNSYVNIDANIALPLCRMVAANGVRDWMNVYGIGNHGGGPTRAEIDYLIEAGGWPIYPRVIFSTARGFFEAAARQGRDLPSIGHELNFEFTGCYTSQSLIKQANRLGENYCLEAEVLAALTSPTDRRELLRNAWINVLFNQFHDILPGSGVRETREHAMALFQETAAITGSIKRDSLKELVEHIDTLSLLPETPEGMEERRLFELDEANTPWVAGAGIGARLSGYSQSVGGGRHFKPIVVFNPCAWARSEMVQVALYDTGFDEHRIVAMDEKGARYPTMSLGKGHDWGHDKITVLFAAKDVPALGYKTFLLCEGDANVDIPSVTAVGNEEFETPHLKVKLNRHHGGCDSIGLRDSAFKPIADYCGMWQYTVERDKIMSAWVLGEEVDPPVELRSTQFRTFGPRHNEATLLTDKSGLTACRAVWDMNVPGTTSKVKLTAVIHGLSPRIDFEAELDWREIGSKESGIPGLVLEFAGGGSEAGSTCETPFGHVTRGFLEEEVPTLRYLHLPADRAHPGLTVLQNGKYGFNGRTAGGTVMRVIRSSFDPDHAPEVNRQTFRYSIYLHDRPIAPSELTRLGAAFNHPLIVAPANIQAGDQPSSKKFAEVETPNVLLTSLKPGEHGGLVLRLVEYDGQDTVARVWLSHELLPEGAKSVCVDALEREIPGEVRLEGQTLTVPIRRYGMASVKIG